MNRVFTCILCPNSCDIEIDVKDNVILRIDGNGCARGKEYVEQEIINPLRIITTSVLVDGGELPLVSVRLSKPIPKSRIYEVMAEIKKQRLTAPVKMGDIIIRNVSGTGSDVIATKNIAAALTTS